MVCLIINFCGLRLLFPRFIILAHMHFNTECNLIKKISPSNSPISCLISNLKKKCKALANYLHKRYWRKWVFFSWNELFHLLFTSFGIAQTALSIRGIMVDKYSYWLTTSSLFLCWTVFAQNNFFFLFLLFAHRHLIIDFSSFSWHFQ